MYELWFAVDVGNVEAPVGVVGRGREVETGGFMVGRVDDLET